MHREINVGSILFAVGALLAVGASILAQQGYRGRDHVVGIDLGTTYSVVAISQQDKVTVIADQNGSVLTPSTVAFLAQGATLVGREARAHGIQDPRHTIFNAKRFIGRSLESVLREDEDVAASYEFDLSSEDAANASTAACFSLRLEGHTPCVTPVDVGAHIVRHLRHLATRFVGHDQIDKAVIAVPVDFDAAQRAATVAAFEAAGLRVSRVLEEPTAAAIAYGLHQDPSVSFILVFDFGGGTLDVSLLFSRSGSVSVVDTVGDNHLGGEDVDEIIAKHLTQQIGAAVGQSVSTHRRADEEDGDDWPCTPAGIRRAAERLKRELSEQHEASARCVSTSKRGEPEFVRVSMTRQELESLCEPLLARTLVPIREILEANSMTTNDIDAVVLVGGSTRIPWVREKLTEMFGGRPPLTDVDPDVAVAFGAARMVD
ncbi:hypothetical protein ATCC90586_000522 [Pythium insidiosum]|nr:hypothetical protein ATCC90586_000522 [Pythium insidiosum]